jgi:Tfp pilus assembly protein PilN
MQSFNLIPAHRFLARKRALRISRWMTVCILYGVLVAVFYLAFLARHKVASQDDLEARIRDVANEINAGKQNLSHLKQEYAEAERALHASNAVGPQPDWSVLLAALASQTGDNIVLRSCALSPVVVEEAAREPTHDPQSVDGFSLSVAGFGRSQRDVSDFVLRLEGMALLDAVSLVNSRREPFLSDYAIVFEVKCSIEGAGRSER